MSEIFVFVNSPFPKHRIHKIVERLNHASGIVLVDGGINQFCALLDSCKENNLSFLHPPNCLIGDFDSVAPESYLRILKEYPDVEVIKYARNKDFTDLEGALQYIQNKFPSKPIVILTGLNNRIDHALGNILYLFRDTYQGQVSIFTPDEEIIANCPKDPFFEQRINNKKLTTVSLYSEPKNGLTKDSNTRLKENFDEIALCIISDHNFESQLKSIKHSTYLNHCFGKNECLIQDFKFLLNCIENPFPFYIQGPSERLFVVNHSSNCCFDTLKGQTISLIPLGGPVCGVSSEGLYWGLQNATLNKDFYSISNLAVGIQVKLSCSQGSLLCIVNNLIDEHLMHELKL